MLIVDKINTNITFKANNFHGSQVFYRPNDYEAKALYFDMNKQAITDFADGDISLLDFLGDKIKQYWHLITNQKDPVLELKAKLIEENIKNLVKTQEDTTYFVA